MRLRAMVLILTLALGLLAAPLPAEAQRAGKVYRIGWLTSFAKDTFRAALQRELQDLGRVEGRDFVIEHRSSLGRRERLPALAADLVRLNTDVIVTFGTVATQAAVSATKTIPIVFWWVSDPLASGFVASLSRPGGNVTGLTTINAELAGKRLQLLKELLPGISRIAVFWDPRSKASALGFRQTEVAIERLGLTLQSVEWGDDPYDVESAFAAITGERADALLVLFSARIWKYYPLIMPLALKHQLPPASDNPYFTQHGGGLISYTPNQLAMVRRVAQHVDKILRGAKPADIPVEQPTKFQLWINLKTAKALGLTIRPSLLFQADKVIK